jgi:hypothetical protein
MNCLYNGVELPALPGDEYPFKVIARTVSGTYRLYVFDAEETLIVEYNTNGTLWNMSLTPANGQSYDVQDSEWVLNEDSQGTIIIAMFLAGQPRSEIVWTSYDILNEDGSPYMPKSPDPVPVGGDTPEPEPTPTAPDIHPASFMAGLRMGQIVRAML